jgi:hypothetical protein
LNTAGVMIRIVWVPVTCGGSDLQDSVILMIEWELTNRHYHVICM